MNGRNFLIRIDGKPRKHGFYQNIFIEADNPENAELLAVDKIRQNEELRQVTLNSKEDPPMIYLDSIWEIDDIGDEDTKLEKGRTFYTEKKWWQFWK